MSVAHMIEVAEHNGWCDVQRGTIFSEDRRAKPYAVQLYFERCGDGWHAECYDTAQKRFIVWIPDGQGGREEALRQALDGYLDLVNVGI